MTECGLSPASERRRAISAWASLAAGDAAHRRGADYVAYYLTTTRLSVAAIARRTGYGTDASLSKAFKREFGISPGQYRDSNGSVAVWPVVSR